MQDFQLFATRDSDFARAGELGALGVGTSGGSASSGDSDLALPHFMRANVRLGPCSNVLGARLAGAERLMAGATRILGLDALAGGLRKAGAAGAAAIGPRRASESVGNGCDTASDAARGTGKQGAAAAFVSPRHNSGDVSESESAGGADAACTSPTSMAAEELEPDSVVTLSVAFSQASLLLECDGPRPVEHCSHAPPNLTQHATQSCVAKATHCCHFTCGSAGGSS